MMTHNTFTCPKFERLILVCTVYLGVSVQILRLSTIIIDLEACLCEHLEDTIKQTERNYETLHAFPLHKAETRLRILLLFLCFILLDHNVETNEN